MKNVINQVDHIMIQTKYAEKVFEVLTKVLDLPIAWDMKSYGGFFTSGGVSFGNTNIEIINWNKIFRMIGIAPKKDGIAGIAFEPSGSVEDTCSLLNEMKIKHGKSRPFKVEIKGEKKILWENIDLKRILAKHEIFFCKYFYDVNARRNRRTKELEEANGGTLGAEGIKQITLGYADEKILDLWKRLSNGNYDEKSSCISFGSGPLIKMVKSKEDAILSITVKVKSIDEAVKALLNSQYAEIGRENELIIKGAEESSLGIMLSE